MEAEIPEECSSLPALCQDALTSLLAQVRLLPPDAAFWLDATWESFLGVAHSEAFTDAWDAARDDDREGALEAARDAAPPIPAARDAVAACVILDMEPAAARTLMTPWHEGLALLSWVHSAPTAQVEVARRLFEDWQGSISELVEVAAACVGEAPVLPEECAGLPPECRDALLHVLTEARALTPDASCWVLPPAPAYEEAWDELCDVLSEEVLVAARAAGQAAALEALSVVVGDSWETPYDTVIRAAQDAAMACAALSSAPYAARIVLAPWREGMELITWASTAPPAQVELARTLRPAWTNTPAELIETAAACVELVPIRI